ncbi:LOW QUALITY PROTEIN: coiled-coil domain-containing protein 150 [Aegotheles albertisi]
MLQCAVVKLASLPELPQRARPPPHPAAIAAAAAAPLGPCRALTGARPLRAARGGAGEGERTSRISCADTRPSLTSSGGSGPPRAGARAAMAGPAVIPAGVRATAPEALTVLCPRVSVEEQTSALMRDLEALGVNGQSLDHFHSKSQTPASHPAISPMQARVPFVGENTLWKNCETLVKLMCLLESVVQTLKLNIFQLQTEKKLDPKHTAQLEQCLNAIEEHLQEMKIVELEAMKLCQHQSDMKEAEEKAKAEVQSLSAALEIATASKIANVQHQLDTAKDDNSKATAMLEHVLASCSKVHAALDAVQTELGHKDTEISNLRSDDQTQKIQRLEREWEHFQAKLLAMGRQHSSQVEPLYKALEGARIDNKKLVLILEKVLQVKYILLSKLIPTQYELRKETEHHQLMVCREQLIEKAKTEEMYTEHLKSLKKQFQTEQEASRKAVCHESAEETESALRKMKAVKEEYLTSKKSVLESKNVQSKLQVLLKNQPGEVQVQTRLLKRQLETQLKAERRQRQQLENECQVNGYQHEKVVGHPWKHCAKSMGLWKSNDKDSSHQLRKTLHLLPGEQAGRSTTRISPDQQHKDLRPPPHHQEGPRELGRK